MNYITLKAIKEIQSKDSPIHLVKSVQAALSILLAESKTDWKNSNLNLCDALRYFDRNNVTDETLDRLAPFINNDQFVPNKVAKVFLIFIINNEAI